MAQLTIQYTRDVLSAGYYLGVDVLSGVDIDPVCVVASVGRGGSPEQIARIATLNDFVDIQEAPSAGYVIFYDPTLFTFAVAATDIIVLSHVPPLWTRLGYAGSTQHTVSSTDPSTDSVVVTPAFPAYADGLSYVLYDSGMVLKATILSSGTAMSAIGSSWDAEIYYRMQTINSAIAELQGAINTYSALQSEAQSLVDSTEQYLEEYSGTDTEIYT